MSGIRDSHETGYAPRLYAAKRRPPSAENGETRTSANYNHPKSLAMNSDRISGAGSLRSITPHAIDLDVSRLSNSSTHSTVTLGGSHYPVGTTVGSSGLFVIGDPSGGSTSRSRSMTSINTDYSIRQLIESKGYDFEGWNWPVIRFSCLIALICVMLALLFSVIGLTIAVRGHCDVSWMWWQGGLIYRINVPEFSDQLHRNDIGDFLGIEERIPYLQKLGVAAVSLRHFLASKEPGYEEMMAFERVEPRLGTMIEFQSMVRALHKAEIKVILEIDPTRTSNEHDWFYESRRQSAISGNDYKAIYVWRDTVGDPNIWQYDSVRNQYYQVVEGTDEPIINWKNDKAKDKFKKALVYWLEEGDVDGFQIHNLDQFYDTDDSQVYEMVESWRYELDAYSKTIHDHILIIASSYLQGVKQRSSSLVEQFLEKIDILDQSFSVHPSNITYDMEKALKDAYWWLPHVNNPHKYNVWTSLQWVNISLITMEYWPVVHQFLLSAPGTPSLHAGQEIGRDHEIKVKLGDRVRLITWTSGEDPMPYEKGSILDIRKLNQLIFAIDLRSENPSLRAFFDIDGDTVESIKAYVLKDIDQSTLLLERRYRHFNKFFWMANVGELKQTRDWSNYLEAGEVFVDTKGEFTGNLLFDNVLIQAAQGFIVKYYKE